MGVSVAFPTTGPVKRKRLRDCGITPSKSVQLGSLTRLRKIVSCDISEVVEIVKAPGDGAIDVHVRQSETERVETLRTRFVVWAADDYTLLRCVEAVG